MGLQKAYPKSFVVDNNNHAHKKFKDNISEKMCWCHDFFTAAHFLA
jgi:hypothetical protein